MSVLPSLADAARLARASTPDALAVVDGAMRWTWRTFDTRVDVVADGLRKRGVGTGTRVVLPATPSADLVAVLHGVARVGGVAAPMAAGLSDAELARITSVLDPVLVVHEVGWADGAATLGRPVVSLGDLVEGHVPPAIDLQPPTHPAAPTDPAAPAVAILTSGTTGHPRVAVLSTAALIASAEAWLAALPPATGWLVALGLGHVAGLGVAWRAALTRVPLVVLPRADPAAIMAALATDPWPSHVSLVPTMLARILEVATDGPPPTLRAVLLGGGPIPPVLVTRSVRAGWPIVPTYGLTEAGSGVTALSSADAGRYPDSAGPPLPGVEIRIDGADRVGIGEIQVRTPARFSGYLREPPASRAMFTHDGWLRTGDLGRLDEAGRLTVSDRRTDRIVRGGENISPMEIEAVLLLHPSIVDAAVVARRDATWGHVAVAAIVLDAQFADPGDAVLTQHCRDHLPAFKVPVAFVRSSALPRTAGGKLRRSDLRDRLDSPAEAGPQVRHLDRPDGQRLAYRCLGDGPTPLLLLHGTLSTAAQLSGLTRALAVDGLTVLAIDRRGSGGSRMAEPGPLDVAVHVADVDAILRAEGHPAAILVGVSFGAVVALEFAARLPERALAIVAYEPPYGPLADADTQAAFARVATATERAHDDGGAAAAEAFVRGVAGLRAWDRLPERTRVFLADEGDGAYVDAALMGLDAPGLGRIRVPTTILTGGASEPFYRPIAKALMRRIPGSATTSIPDLGHAAPITDPGPVAEIVLSTLARAGVIGTEASSSRTTDRIDTSQEPDE